MPTDLAKRIIPGELTYREIRRLRPRGMEVALKSISATQKNYHTPQILSSKEEELLIQYKTRIRTPVLKMREAADKLDNGEKDVLNEVREALSWPTVLSLAYKYYSLYPHRKWWLEALRRAQKWARFVNIRYLLLTLRSIKLEKEANRQKTMDGLSIDTPLNKERIHQLMQLNEQRLKAHQLAKLALSAEGGAIG